jgi:trans-aconitate methyltransferase
MKWDSGRYDSRHGFVAEYGKGLLEYIPVDKAQKILDLGCGTGVLTTALADRCGYVLGIDSSTEMIGEAKRQHPHIEFLVMNALELPYQEEWDVVFSNAVFHWISDHDLLLRKIRQALKPSGKLVCEFGAHGNIETMEEGFRAVLQEMGVAYRSGFNFPTADAFGALLVQNGFSIEEIHAYDRPTPLKNGEQGLYDWIKQFFGAELESFPDADQDRIIRSAQEKVRNRLWDGKEWTADYRRLRVIAAANGRAHA